MRRIYSKKLDMLGRWSIIAYHYKESLKLRIILVYRQHVNNGPYCPYRKHLSYYSTNDEKIEHIKKYDMDVIKMISN